jgi:ribosomal protein S18 acetylase RimI-like enzyme
LQEGWDSFIELQKANREVISIRNAKPEDDSGIWSILEPMIRAGETYDLPRSLSREEALAYWHGAGNEVFVAEEDGAVVGTYVLRANRQGGGAHVSNCGYVTAPFATGRGVASAMCRDSMARASAAGFRAMQFNFVISTNERAVNLWKHHGFEIVGTLPKAFLHPTVGYVDVFVMFRVL